LAAQARRLSLLELVELNPDADIALSMDRIVQAAGLSRAEAVDRLNAASRRFGVRLASGSAKELGVATFEKWLNPKEADYVPSVRALNLFCHVFGAVEPLDILARSHGMGWRDPGNVARQTARIRAALADTPPTDAGHEPPTLTAVYDALERVACARCRATDKRRCRACRALWERQAAEVAALYAMAAVSQIG